MTGSKRSTVLELAEHFSEDFTGDGNKISFQLSKTGVGKNLLDYSRMYATSSARCETLSEDVLHIYTTENKTYAGVKGPTLTLRQGTTYTFSLDVTSIYSGDIYFGFRYVESGSFASGATAVTSTGHFKNRITPETDIEVYPSILVTWSTAAEGDAIFKNLQVEVGSIDTAYTPYECRDGQCQIVSVSVNGSTLTSKQYLYSIQDGVLILKDTPAPSKGSIVNISYDHRKYSFTGRVTNAWQYKMDARTIGLIFEFTSPRRCTCKFKY